MGLALIKNRPWAITQDGLELVIAVASRDEFFSDVRAKALASAEQPLANVKNTVVGNAVAVIPVCGPLFRHADIIASLSGASSYEGIRKEFDKALADTNVATIILDFDSPGGEVHGCGDLAAHIFASRGKKAIIGYASGTCASAAYWLASACNSIVADPSALIGSIGVRTAVVDDSKAQEMEGKRTIQIVSSQSPYKVVDASNTSDVERVRDSVTAMAAVFVSDVARHRGVSDATVIAKYGKGDVFVGGDAVTAGLIDSIGDLNSLVASRGNQMAKAKASMEDEDCDGCGKHMAESAAIYCGECKADASFGREVLAVVGGKDAATAMGSLIAMKAQAERVEQLTAELKAIKVEQASAEVSSLLAEAARDGRVTPAKKPELEKLYATHGMDALKACLALMPKSATAAVEPASPAAARPVDVDQNIAQMLRVMGVSQEKYAEAVRNRPQLTEEK